MKEVGSQEARNLLSENTEEALREGAFGLPWIAGALLRAQRPLGLGED